MKLYETPVAELSMFSTAKRIMDDDDGWGPAITPSDIEEGPIL